MMMILFTFRVVQRISSLVLKKEKELLRLQEINGYRAISSALCRQKSPCELRLYPPIIATNLSTLSSRAGHLPTMHAYVELSKCKMCTQKPLSVKMRKVQLLVHINQRIALRMSFDAAQRKKKKHRLKKYNPISKSKINFEASMKSRDIVDRCVFHFSHMSHDDRQYNYMRSHARYICGVYRSRFLAFFFR